MLDGWIFRRFPKPCCQHPIYWYMLRSVFVPKNIFYNDHPLSFVGSAFSSRQLARPPEPRFCAVCLALT